MPLFFFLFFPPGHSKNVVSQVCTDNSLARFTDSSHYGYCILFKILAFKRPLSTNTAVFYYLDNLCMRPPVTTLRTHVNITLAICNLFISRLGLLWDTSFVCYKLTRHGPQLSPDSPCASQYPISSTAPLPQAWDHLTPPQFCWPSGWGSQYWQLGLCSWRSNRCTELPVVCEAAAYAAIINDWWATRQPDTTDLRYLLQQEQLWLCAGRNIMYSTEEAWINGIIKLQNPRCCSLSTSQTSCSHQKAKGKSQ